MLINASLSLYLQSVVSLLMFNWMSTDPSGADVYGDKHSFLLTSERNKKTVFILLIGIAYPCFHAKSFSSSATSS